MIAATRQTTPTFSGALDALGAGKWRAASSHGRRSSAPGGKAPQSVANLQGELLGQVLVLLI